MQIRPARVVLGMVTIVMPLCAVRLTAAETLHVPDTYGTIQEAIDAADDGDVVEIADGTYTGAGNKELEFGGKAITVRGESGDPDLCIIDCENDGRGFFIDDEETSSTVIEDLTVTRGYANGSAFYEDDGGAVYIGYLASPTITNCKFTECKADDRGDAIYCGNYSSPTITGCEVIDTDGIGIYTDQNCSGSFTGCVVTGSTLQGVYCVSSGATTFSDCTISANEAGGVKCYGDGHTFSDCDISDNLESGVYCLLGSSMFTDCSINDNVASGGGGVRTTDASTLFINCTISGNEATSYIGGGGVLCSSDAPTFLGCDITQNESITSGGGVEGSGCDPIFIDCTINRNTCGTVGGGVSLDDCDGTFIRTRIDGNNDSGVYIQDGASVFANCSISGNDGGGAAFFDCEATLLNCAVNDNAGTYITGGLYFYNASADVTNCTIVTNSNTVGDGAGVYCNGSTVQLDNCIVFWCDANPIYGISSTLTVSYSNVQGGWSGTGNIDAYSMFVDRNGPDNIQDTWQDNDYRLSDVSPCIDAADNSAVPADTADVDDDDDTGEITPLDFAGNLRFVDDPGTTDTGSGTAPIVDMGAFEYAVSSMPYVELLTVSPVPAFVGDRLTVTANLAGGCALARYVVFDIVPGADCDVSNSIWQKWIARDAACDVSVYPLVQESWNDGSGQFTIMARAYWVDGGGAQYSSPVCLTIDVSGPYPDIDSLTCSPDPATIGSRVTLDAEIGGDCSLADYIVLNVIPGNDCDLSGAVWSKWIAPGGACEVLSYPIVQADWDDGSGTCTVMARAYWNDGSGAEFSDAVCTDLALASNDPFVDALTASPDPVPAGDRVTMTATLDGDCSMAEYVVFYAVPGSDCDIANAVWSKWIDPAGACEAVTYPVVQSGWNDGTDTFTVAARVYWDDGSGAKFSDVVCTEASTYEKPFIDSLAATPDPVLIGDRVTLTATLGGACARTDYVIFYIVPGSSCDTSKAVFSKWIDPAGACTAVTYPLAQSGWDDGSGKFTAVAIAYWNDGSGAKISAAECLEVGIGARSAPSVLYVNAGAAPGGDGLSWTSALNDLRDALDSARFGGVGEIWVAQGVYSTAPPEGERTLSFDLVEGVALYGGFSGRETDRRQRDPRAHQTILSGDLLPSGASRESQSPIGAYHVVRAVDVTRAARLDGFVIRGGHADGWDDDASGGGLFIDDASPTIVGCIIEANHARDLGGGVVILGDSSPLFVSNILRRNSATYGGALASDSSRAFELSNCVVSGNHATMWGGGFYTSAGLDVRQSTLVGNTAGALGGGVYSETAPQDPLFFVNSILWANRSANADGEAAQVAAPFDAALFHHCCIEGWSGLFAGDGCFGDDPLFVDADGADGHYGTFDDVMHLRQASPCLDAGGESLLPADAADLDGDGDKVEALPYDLRGELRACDGDANGSAAPDLGAFESACEPQQGCTGDLDGDGDVDQSDLGIVLDSYERDAGGDVNGDALTDQVDLGILLAHYGCET